MRYRRRTRPKPWLYAVCASALLLLVFLNGKIADSGLNLPFSAIFATLEVPLDALSRNLSGVFDIAVSIPDLSRENAQLRAENVALNAQIMQAREHNATRARDRAVLTLSDAYTRGIVADCIGYDPENVRRSITLDQGSLAGVTRNAGVINEEGVVGDVVAVTPFSSTVLLLDSYASNIPAIVQQGRFWGIARGSLTHVKLDNVALDAPLKLGDLVVTGRGRSFPAGIAIGKIIAVSRSDAALTQSAILTPSVHLSRLERVVVLPHLEP